MGITKKDILRYKQTKEEFYQERKKKANIIIDKEYCEFEEGKYGEYLSGIYVTIDKIRQGKIYCKRMVIDVILLIIGVILMKSSWTPFLNIDFSPILIIALLGILFIRIVIGLFNVGKIIIYLDYTFAKLKDKLNIRKLWDNLWKYF